jgi:hypothetical protein
MKTTAFWDVAPWNLVEVDRRFRGVYCLHHQGDGLIQRLHGPAYQKAAIFILAAVRT